MFDRINFLCVLTETAWVKKFIDSAQGPEERSENKKTASSDPTEISSDDPEQDRKPQG